MDRHWWNCLTEQMRAAAQSESTALRLDAIDGGVLLGQAAIIHERSIGLLDELERRLHSDEEEVDTRSVVAALREVRASLESLAKLSFAVQDRPAPPTAEERPSIDAAILQALEKRNVDVTKAPEHRPFDRVYELPAAST